MRFVDIIEKKRRGDEHTPEEIRQLVSGIQDKSIPDYQLSAWLMAVCFNGMTLRENAILTEEIAKSGTVLDLSKIGEYVIDKHSTGGVGDKATLILVPLLAAAGMPVAKLAGRGLGHTGGTIDKLESIPGFNCALTTKDFIAQVQEKGSAIASQTSELTPADGVLYALRDVTSTIDSIPLIAASVVSKKIASGANVIILDVKFGAGSFMKSYEQAKELSQRMVDIGKYLGRSVVACITSMEQPLGKCIGNAVEIVESIETLKGNGPSDLRELCTYLGAVALVKAKRYPDIEQGIKALNEVIENGSALRKFRELIQAQGGNSAVIDDYTVLPQAKYTRQYKATQSGFVKTTDAMGIAKACKLLGAGRDKKDDPIDYAVGVVLNKQVSDSVEAGEVLATIYGNDEELVAKAATMLEPAFEIVAEKVARPTLIHETIE